MSRNKKNSNIYTLENKKTRSEHSDYDTGISEIPDDAPKRKKASLKNKIGRFIKKTAKKTGNGKRRIPTVALVITVVVIFLIVFLVANINSGGVLSTVNGQVSSFFHKKSTQKFSVNTDSSNVFCFEKFGNGYVMLTDSGISYVSSSGTVTAKQQLTYSDPSIEISGDRVLIFDRGNTSYSLQRNKALYAQQSVDSSIITGDLCGKNNYTIAVRGEKSVFVLYGYDAQGKVIYQWNCPNGYITDVSMSTSGGKVAVTTIDSSNAVLSSSVSILDFEYDSPYVDFTYSDETVIATEFLSSQKVIVITDKNVYLISGKEQEVIYSYGNSDICYFDMSRGSLIGIITTDHSNDESYSLTLISKHGNVLFTNQINGRVKGLSCSERVASVLYYDKAETYSKNGKLVGSVSGINHFNDIVVNGNYIYVLYSDYVRQYPAFGTVTQEEKTG